MSCDSCHRALIPRLSRYQSRRHTLHFPAPADSKIHKCHLAAAHEAERYHLAQPQPAEPEARVECQRHARGQRYRIVCDEINQRAELLAPDAAQVNVAAQETDPRSDLHYFRALTRLRAEHPALVAGTYRSLCPRSPGSRTRAGR